MKLSQVVEIIHKCKNYELMLGGINQMIMKSPDNDKKEMVLDVIKFGRELTTKFQRFAGSNEYLQAVNLAREGELNIAERRIKELELELKRFKEGI